MCARACVHARACVRACVCVCVCVCSAMPKGVKVRVKDYILASRRFAALIDMSDESGTKLANQNPHLSTICASPDRLRSSTWILLPMLSGHCQTYSASVLWPVAPTDIKTK